MIAPGRSFGSAFAIAALALCWVLGHARTAAAAYNPPIDVVRTLDALCASGGLAPGARAALRCDAPRAPAATALGAARAAPAAIAKSLGFDPCGAVAALLDGDDVPTSDPPELRALEATCGLASKTTRKTFLALCDAIEARAYAAGGDHPPGDDAALASEAAAAKVAAGDVAPLQMDLAKLRAVKRPTAAQSAQIGADEAKIRLAGRLPDLEKLQALDCPRLASERATTVAQARRPPTAAECKVAGEESGGSAISAQKLCASFHESAGVASLLVPAIEGLGDFFEAQAKKELIAFALGTLGRAMCDPRATDAHPLGPDAFPHLCKVLFPKSFDDPDLDAITSGRFSDAFQQDLAMLPALLARALPIDGVPDGAAIRVIVVTLVGDLADLKAGRVKALDYVARVDHDVAAALGAAKPRCSFAGPAPPSLPCAALLLVSLAGTAGLPVDPANPTAGTNGEHVEDWTRAAAAEFCAAYGPAPAAQAGGPPPDPAACILVNQSPDVWQAISQFQDAFGGFLDRLAAAIAQYANDKSRAKPLSTLADDAAVIADAFGEFGDGLLRAACAIDAQANAGLCSDTEATFALPGLALHAAADALGRDTAKLAKDVRAIVASDLAKQEMAPAFRTSLLFFLDLASATDRASASQVVEDAAAPLGTYKEKYARAMVSIGGLVGVMGGYRWRFTKPTGPPSSSSDDNDGGDVVPLGAPMGIDLSMPFCDRWHFGALLTPIDPLAIDPSNPNGQLLNGVLAPGVFLRLGLLGSPLVLMAGARGQPVLESTHDTCGSNGMTACFKGSFSILAGLAVDVPVLNLSSR